MADESARRAHHIFMKALDLEPDEHEAFLDAECGDDKALRQDVESLLRAHGAADSFLEEPTIGPRRAGLSVPERDGPELLGRRIGRYTLEEVIASGGMGTVFLATQERPNRRVAVKVLDRRRTSRDAQRRFEYEAEILAKLEHPHIAGIYEAGMQGSGGDTVSYFAMEHIAGARSITAYAVEKGLSIKDRLALFVKVCDAVSYAHQHGIIHRDLKPANILVDAEGEPKVIDFGVARIIDLDTVITTLKTDAGQIVGTLAYMSPEQVEAEPGDIDIRTDVYSLGVILYELLCERLPTRVDTSSLLKVADRIRTQPPERPSAIKPTLRGDVETIVLKALEKDRRGRYQSARDLADDIRRHLSDQPILATPPTLFYLLSKFTRRHRVLVTAASVVLLVLVAATIVSTVFAVRMDRESRRRLAAEIDARQAEQVASSQRDEARWQAYVANIAAAEAALGTGEFRRLRSRLDATDPAHRDWEWRYLDRRSDQSRHTMVHGGRVMSVATGPDGDRLATASFEGRVQLWDLHSGSRLATIPGHDDGAFSVAFSPDGRHIVSGGGDQLVRVWDLESGAMIEELAGHTQLIHAVAYSSAGTKIVSGSWDHTARIWNLDDRSKDLELRGHTYRVRSVLFTPDDRRVITGGDDRTIRIWNAESGELEKTIPLDAGEVRSVAITSDGALLAAGATDHVVRVWDTATWRLVAELDDHDDIVWSVAFSPDGRLLASGSADQRIRIWNARTREPINVLPGHAEVIQSLAFTPDSQLLVSGSWDHAAKAWEAAVLRDDYAKLRAHESFVQWMTFSPDGSLLATASSDRTVRLWNPRTLEPLVTIRGHEAGVRGVEFSPDMRRIATCGEDRMVRVRDLATGRLDLAISGHDDTVYSVAFSPDGTRLASGAADGTVRIWNAHTGEEIAAHRDHDDNVWRVAFSPDGRLLASASWDETVRLWDVLTGECVHTLIGHKGDIYALVFSTDGSKIYSGSREQEILVWDVATGRAVESHTEHGQFVTGLALFPDESRLVSTSIYQNLKLWCVGGREDVLTLRGDDASIRSVAVDPDGSRILTGLSNGVIQLWDLLGPAQRDAARVAARDQVSRAEHWLQEQLPQGSDPDRAAQLWMGNPSPPADLLPAVRWMLLARQESAPAVVPDDR